MFSKNREGLLSDGVALCFVFLMDTTLSGYVT